MIITKASKKFKFPGAFKVYNGGGNAEKRENSAFFSCVLNCRLKHYGKRHLKRNLNVKIFI